MSDYSDLIEKFGGKDETASKSVVATPHDDLITKYGGGSEWEATPGAGIGGSTKIEAKKVGDVGYTVNPDDFKKPAYKGEGGKSTNRLEAGLNDAVTGVNNFILNLPSNAYENVKSSLSTSGDLMSSAATNAMSGHPYKAAGDVGLAALNTAAIPITAPVKTLITDPTTSIVGPDIGGKIGDVASAILPVAGPVAKVAGKVPYYPTASKIQANMPRNRAFQALAEHIEPQNILPTINELRSNPRLSLADVSPGVKQATQNLAANIEGKHLNHISNVVEQRIATAPDAVNKIYDSVLGAPVDAFNKLAELKKAANDVGNNQIQPALKSAKPVDVSPVLDYIDSKIKPGIHQIMSPGSTLPDTEINKALVSVRKLIANSKEVSTDANKLHALQSAIRSKADDLVSSSSGQERQLGKALYAVREKIKKAIDKSVPGPVDKNGIGPYRKALHAYADEKHIDEALRAGHSMLSGSKKLENDPSFTREWVASLSDAEKEAAKVGVRLAIRAEMGTVRNAALKGENIPATEFNKEKLSYLFSKPEIEQMSRLLEQERKIAQTNSDLLKNSQTAIRQKNNAQLDLPAKTNTNQAILPLAMTIGADVAGGGGAVTGIMYGHKFGHALKDVVKTKLAQERNLQYSKMALASDGPLRDQLIQELSAIAAKPPKPSILNRATSALTKVIGP